ncbi:hypothetical protein ACSQ67_014840 [Phaseolus vulgaris]
MENRVPFFFIFLSSFSLTLLLLLQLSSAQMPGFVSLDCGGKENFTDKIGLTWTPDELRYGEISIISVANETRKQYTTLRHFPADSRKYCYSLDVVSRTRYLLRASFLYGNFDANNVYPKFDIFIGATHWSTIVISDANTIEMRELIFLALSPTVSVCLSNATTGKPFISTLELRQFNGSVYYTYTEEHFYLSVSARINFGADSDAPIRYPDDPFDRIWESDSIKKANYLVDVAAGTRKISTNKSIEVSTDEMPPMKVMQTAVVGTNGSLTYRLNLDGFPGFAWAVTYFAEIEDLAENESRKFRLVLPGNAEISKPVVNIEENAPGKYRLYEPGYTNLSLPFVLSFKFAKTSDSARGPLLNAMEINEYLEKNDGSPDGEVISGVLSHYSSEEWAQEGGDPCLPVPWSWVRCSSDQQPKLLSIGGDGSLLSSKNLTGNIPLDITKLTGLVELWLDGNMLTGPIPDFTGCMDLKIIHLENNQLTGALPTSLVNLPNLRELYVQNNMLFGTVPSDLLKKVSFLNYSGNTNLRKDSRKKTPLYVIIGSTVGAAVLLLATIISCLFKHNKGKGRYFEQKSLVSHPSQSMDSTKSIGPAEAAHCYSLSEIEKSTNNFAKKIGSGGFGVVYYGKLNDGKEIAVKVLNSNSYQGKREFSNEVTLLSRIHHRNLVQLLGYCREEGNSMLIYEFMHNGTLKEHLYGIPINTRTEYRLEEAPRDCRRRCKRYYISQQLTDKSDIYSFGVILLELISGQEAISNDSFGANCRNIVQWAKLHIESGDIQGIIDPVLQKKYDLQSMWKIAEKALMCVQPHGHMRPSISEVVKEIQDAIAIERGAEGNSDEPRNSVHSSVNMDMAAPESFLSVDDSIAQQQPTAR